MTKMKRVDPIVGSPRMEVMKFGRSYGYLVMLEMEEDPFFLFFFFHVWRLI